MKKTVVMFITILIFGLLLVACIPSGVNPVGPTIVFTPSVPTPTTTAPSSTASVPSSTTMPEVPTTTLSTAPATTAPPVDPEVVAFTELFRNISMSDGVTRNPYNYSLGQEYTSPMELNLREFFGNGFVGEKTATEAELIELQPYIEGTIWSIAGDFHRLPKDKMDEELQKCFGITLADLPEAAFESLIYLESTDCYCFYASSAHGIVEGFEAKTVEHLDDGTLKVTYTKRTLEIAEYIAILKPNGDGYFVLSNQKAE